MQRKSVRKSKYWVYIVQCKKGTYYTGYTKNLVNRIKEHNNSHGAKYLRGKLPVKLVYAKEYRYYKNARHRERNIKKMTRKQKEELIRFTMKTKFKVKKLGCPCRFAPAHVFRQEDVGANLKAGTPVSRFGGTL